MSRKIGRNELCPCKSGLKYKYCHGDRNKILLCGAVAKKAANECMLNLIHKEKVKRGLICEHGIAKNEHCQHCKVGD